MATTAQANLTAAAAAAAAAAATRDLGDMDDLDELFHAAADHLGQLVTAAPAAVPDSRKLQLYGLYKQATVGACDTAKPAFWDRAGCSKWHAWKKLGDMQQQAAMQQYVQLVALQDPGWLSQQSSCSSTSKASKGGSNLGGPVFSTLMGSSRACSGQETRAGSSATLQELAGQADLAGLTAALNSGINVNSQDEQGCSALHFAADRGHLEVVRLLLAAGADINMQDCDGQTPLHYAAVCQHEEVCRLLLEHGADPSITDNDSQNAQELSPQVWQFWTKG